MPQHSGSSSTGRLDPLNRHGAPHTGAEDRRGRRQAVNLQGGGVLDPATPLEVTCARDTAARRHLQSKPIHHRRRHARATWGDEQQAKPDETRKMCRSSASRVRKTFFYSRIQREVRHQLLVTGGKRAETLSQSVRFWACHESAEHCHEKWLLEDVHLWPDRRTQKMKGMGDKGCRSLLLARNRGGAARLVLLVCLLCAATRACSRPVHD